MSLTLNLTGWLEGEDVQAELEALKAASALPAMVCIALQIGLMLGRWVVEAELAERAAKAHDWPECLCCGRRLQSKGWYRRQMMTLVGEIG